MREPDGCQASVASFLRDRLDGAALVVALELVERLGDAYERWADGAPEVTLAELAAAEERVLSGHAAAPRRATLTHWIVDPPLGFDSALRRRVGTALWSVLEAIESARRG